MQVVMTACHVEPKFVQKLLLFRSLVSIERQKNINIFITFSSLLLLFPLNASNFTLIGSLLLALGMGGVGGVGVGVTKFCNNLFGGGGS